ncbi:MAG: hypothetical protein MZV70_09855 [Desulfobacterales bacterium]|nr:hypothetical protein [Desulfobacterales bacterium]
MEDIEDVLYEQIQDDLIQMQLRKRFSATFEQFCGNDPRPYIETIQKLPPDVSAKGVKWLQGIVDYYCQRVCISAILPSDYSKHFSLMIMEDKIMGKLFGTDGIRGEANRYPMNCGNRL